MSPPTETPSPSGTLPSGKSPLGGRSDRLGNINSYPSAGIHPPSGPSPSGTSPSGKSPLGGRSDRLVNIKSYPSAGIHPPQGTSPSGNLPLRGRSSPLVNNISSSLAGTDPHSDDSQQSQQPQQIMSDMFLPYIRYLEQTVGIGMDTADLKDEEKTASKPPPSVDPSQPLAGGPAIGAALDKTARDSRGRRTRDHDPAQKLRELIAASRQVEATIKAEADKVAATSQTPRSRPSLPAGRGAALDEIEDRAPSSTTGANTGWRRPARSDPAATLQRMTEESRQQTEAFNKTKADDVAATAQTPRSQPDKTAGTWSDCSQSGPGERTKSPPRPPQKARKSPADFEMLRLKDRQTLHRLKRS